MYYPIIFGIAIIAAFIGGRTIVSIIIGSFFGILIGFAFIPTLNIASTGLWVYVFMVLAISMGLGLVVKNIDNQKDQHAYIAISTIIAALFLLSHIVGGIVGVIGRVHVLIPFTSLSRLPSFS